MKKLLFIVPLMAATLATTGCGQRTGQGLTIAIDSDTIVLPKPKVIEPDSTYAVADSDSLSNTSKSAGISFQERGSEEL